MPKMIISVDGVVIGQVALAKERTTLGRRAYNDIVIDNLAVSGEHAVLHMIDGDVEIEDLNSTNGTYVNALRHQEAGARGQRRHRGRRLPHPFPRPQQRGHRPGVPCARRRTSSPRHPCRCRRRPPNRARWSELGIPVLRVLAGPNEGQDVALQKVVTTIGKPGVAVAVVTRRRQGYVAAGVEGNVTLNGLQLGTDAVALQERDVLELGGTAAHAVRADLTLLP